ncbi:hypothetical protein CN403_24040 [Bacillus cereus]|nr:lanthionine synthetase LanC family protein [Bacillus cereus]PFA66966.1 hypothetical protein CN403_24040 [Bacillus cereus]
METLFPNKVEKRIEMEPSLKDFNNLLSTILADSVCYNGRIERLNLSTVQNDSKALIVMKNDIYSGVGGILFLKIFCYVFNNEDSLKDEIEKIFNEMYHKKSDKKSYGVYEEMGSMLYLSYLMTKIICFDKYQTIFYQILSDIIEEIKIEKEVRIDIISGISGVLIVCCRMFQLNKDNSLLEVIYYLVDKIKNNLFIQMIKQLLGKKSIQDLLMETLELCIV